MDTSNGIEHGDCMIDTVSLRIKYPDFRVIDPNLFTPALIIQEYENKFDPQYGRNKYKKYVQNPTAGDKSQEIYKPRLTAFQRFGDDNKPSYDLHIEFSAPKLLFGQSVQELEDGDFGKVVGKLHMRLRNMGIVTTEDNIKNAIVTKAHFGKNIPLAYPATAQDAIAELFKADMGKRKDVNMRHYVNGGQSLYFYASSANIIFYDKLRDIATPKRRSVDKDKFKPEKTLFEELNKVQEDTEEEILRFEVRFAKQQSLDAFISKVMNKKIKGITFEGVFAKEFCKKVLLASWEEIVNNPASQLALKMTKPVDEVFDAMIKNITGKKGAHSLKDTLAGIGLYVLINQYGVRTIRNKIEKGWTAKSWSRLADKIKGSAMDLKELPPARVVSDIQAALNKFDRYDWGPLSDIEKWTH